MCGRFACPLKAEDLSCAVSYKNPATKLYVKVPYMYHEDYIPSFNITRNRLAPIMIHTDRRVLLLGQFGVIPSWVPADDEAARDFDTRQCRVESLPISHFYDMLMDHGGRCVIPCTGYYQWQSSKEEFRMPYFFYDDTNDPEDVKCTTGPWNEKTGWAGVKMLYLAGIYLRHDVIGAPTKYSFTILTRKSLPQYKWIYHRMPVVLQCEDDIKNWLEPKILPTERAMIVLNVTISNLRVHSVDMNKVNMIRNDGPECVERCDEKLVDTKLDYLMKWLEETDTPKVDNEDEYESDECNSNAVKKPKIEPVIDEDLRSDMYNDSILSDETFFDEYSNKWEPHRQKRRDPEDERNHKPFYTTKWKPTETV